VFDIRICPNFNVTGNYCSFLPGTRGPPLHSGPPDFAHPARRIAAPLTGVRHRAHTRLTALCPGPPGWAGTRKVKPIWTLLKQETVSGSGISWTIRKSAPRSRQITMPTPHHSVFTGRMPSGVLLKMEVGIRKGAWRRA